MELKDLAKFKKVVIQCHDCPDADAVGSGFALQYYLRRLGAEAKLVYGGPAEIQKPSLLLMLSALDIEIEHIDALPPDTRLLVTVDCQRGAGNVENFDLPPGAKFAVVDHHRAEIPESEYVTIRPYLASCATLMWDMLTREGCDMDTRVQSALYYGLFTDTNGLSELRHPLDRDLAEVEFDAGLIRTLKNSAITVDELEIVANSLRSREDVGKIGLFQARPCEANLLGFTSDIAQQVVNMDCCVVYCVQTHGVKMSVRSSTREIMASDMAAFICRGAGSGGGSAEKAGGFMSFKGLAEVLAGGKDFKSFLKKRIDEYTKHFDLIYAGNNDEDFGAMQVYKKLPVTVGYVKSTDAFAAGTKITIRTLEGDIDSVTNDNLYLMIGVKGETYPIRKNSFEASYNALGRPFSPKLEYIPAVLNRLTGQRCEILSYAKSCVPNNEKLVRARVLEKAAKVFTQWDTEKYFSGQPGDWLVANEGSHDDCYIVRSDIFAESYEKRRD